MTRELKAIIFISFLLFNPRDSIAQTTFSSTYIQEIFLKSADVRIPNVFTKRIDSFVSINGLDHRVMGKNIVLFSPLFNERLKKSERLDICQYIYKSFENREHEFPIFLVKELEDLIRKN
jgi:hypothetical protein